MPGLAYAWKRYYDLTAQIPSFVMLIISGMLMNVTSFWVRLSRLSASVLSFCAQHRLTELADRAHTVLQEQVERIGGGCQCHAGAGSPGPATHVYGPSRATKAARRAACKVRPPRRL